MKRTAILFCLLLPGAAARAESRVSLDLRIEPEVQTAREGNLLQVQDSRRTKEFADLRWQADALALGTVRGVVTAQNRDAQKVVVNELSFDRAAGSGFLTAGKKVMSWDVGYAFRPIDVVQQEDRRALRTPTLEGVPMLAWEAFDAERALTVVLSNPGRGRASQPRDDGALAVRLYRRIEASDQYAVLRLSRRNGIEGGAACSHVEGDALELHASILLQQRHEQWMGAGAPQQVLTRDPAHWQRFDGGGKALVGMTWTTEDKLSLFAEAWIDRAAFTGAQWNAWQKRNSALQAMSLPAPLRLANLAWNADSLQTSSLRQRNVMVRASQNRGDTELAADVLWMPEDGGRISSASWTWKSSPWLASLSVRSFAGNPNSIVRALPLRSLAIASLQHSF
jgi:hypothetical protein